MIILTVVGVWVLLSAIFVISVCMISSRMSRIEEMPLAERQRNSWAVRAEATKIDNGAVPVGNYSEG